MTSQHREQINLSLSEFSYQFHTFRLVEFRLRDGDVAVLFQYNRMCERDAGKECNTSHRRKTTGICSLIASDVAVFSPMMDEIVRLIP